METVLMWLLLAGGILFVGRGILRAGIVGRVAGIAGSAAAAAYLFRLLPLS
jgi:hypothetical protein